MPKLAFFFVLFTLSSIGLPGLNGFVSEFLTILGAFTSAAPRHRLRRRSRRLGIILGAVYMLHMAARVIFGPLKVPGGSRRHDGITGMPTPHADAHEHAAARPRTAARSRSSSRWRWRSIILGVMPEHRR